MHDIFKVLINDRTYTVWDYTYIEDDASTTFTASSPNATVLRTSTLGSNCSVSNITEFPSPLEKKWFNQDMIQSSHKKTLVISNLLQLCPEQDTVNEIDTTEYKIIRSPTRNATHISGILILEGNKTYGRTKNKKRLLYRCIPDDRHLPHFLVPYDLIIDFNKCHKNKYVLFRFHEWTDEHPQGMLVETLGDVNQVEAFYEYQLYSKSLHSSVKEMTQCIKNMTKKKSMEEYFQQILENPTNKIQDLTKLENPPQVFTIDPTNTTDYDDGLSIHTCPDTGFICVTVYIANVVFWLEIFQLWNSFDNRISTIYLPDKRRPMLPSILSESLCSLKENTRRFALSVQFFINPHTSLLDESKTKIQNVVISPYKNYVYDEAKMVHQDVNYIQLLEHTIRIGRNIKNSRDVVSFWMIQTNTWMAQYMIQHKTGIFRVGKFIQRDTNKIESQSELHGSSEEHENYLKLDDETKRYIEYHAKAKSVCYNENSNLEHEVFTKKAYLRITSVIRRYEDICNERELMRIMGIELKEKKIDYDEEDYNERNKRIKRIESESEMIDRIRKGKSEVEGIIYSMKKELDGMYEYKVYIKGEGIKEVKNREKKELYKKYKIKRYIKEEKGMRVKIEIESV